MLRTPDGAREGELQNFQPIEEHCINYVEWL